MAFARRMRSLSPQQIRLQDPFWNRYQKVLVETTLPTQFEQLEKTNRLENFRRAAKKLQGDAEPGHFEGIYFNDSDVYKFIEACAYAIAGGEHLTAEAGAKLRGMLAESTELVLAAQEPDGYLNTFFTLEHPTMHWRNLGTMHEMYCAGHMIEAAVAVFESLGDRQLLDAAIRLADHIMSVFGPAKKLGYPGHEELELALVRLTIATGDVKYREFADWLVNRRGQSPSPFEAEFEDKEALALSPWAGNALLRDGKFDGEYAQDHAPIREHTEIVGHAVRAMYLYIAATDLADGREDEALESALERIWNNLTRRRMYVTGGIGPSSKNEGFTSDFDLPNLTAYAETCAACGLVFWGQKLLELTGNSEYADIVERALYNGVISGISLDGSHYFYDNPLESRGQHQRVPWFHCACCPPNIARLLGSVERYIAGLSDEGFYLHIPVALEANVEFEGVPVRISIESGYPWDGKVKVAVEPSQPVQFSLNIRIPDWSDEVETDLPGAEEEAGYEGGYATFDRLWKSGDVLSIDLGIAPKWVESDPRVRDNLGRTALTLGPLVYCAEEPDLGYAPQLFSADTEAEVGTVHEKALPGISFLEVDGTHEVELFPDGLYAEVGTTDIREGTAKFIPYFAWNNRGKANMQVWVRKL